MFAQRLRSVALESLTAAALLLVPAIGAAQRHGGGGHGGGGHGGGHPGGFSHGGHPGGFSHGGFHHGGFHDGGHHHHHGNAFFFGYGLGYYPGFYGGYGYGYGYPYYDPWYYGYGPRYYYDYGPDYYYPPPVIYNPVPRGYPQPLATYAHIGVRVPAGTELWFEGEKTTQKGTSREFDSPPLTPGHEYTYEIQAKWREGDQDVNQTRSVVVRAGEQVNVDFTKPPAPVEPPAKSTAASSTTSGE